MFGQDNFICSTKCDWKSQKIMVGIAAVLCAVLLIFLWSNAGIIMRQRNLMLMMIVLTIGLVGTVYMGFMRVLSSSLSYVTVYNDHVEGHTWVQMKWFNTQYDERDFHLNYDEILQVEANGNILVIYTSYTQYKVMAARNKLQAISEIKSRIPKK